MKIVIPFAAAVVMFSLALNASGGAQQLSAACGSAQQLSAACGSAKRDIARALAQLSHATRTADTAGAAFADCAKQRGVKGCQSQRQALQQANAKKREARDALRLAKARKKVACR